MKSRFYFALGILMVGMMVSVRAGDPQALGEKQPPKLLERVMPVYPADAKDQKIEGNVILDAVINEKGEVVEVKEKVQTDKDKPVERAHPSLVKAAIDAVKQWKYEPYKDPATGNAQSVRISVTLKFDLK